MSLKDFNYRAIINELVKNEKYCDKANKKPPSTIVGVNACAWLDQKRA